MSEATSGLVVHITPSQSAFFAGEVFSATIKFSNPAPPQPPPPSVHQLHSLSTLSLAGPRTAGLPSQTQRVPSAPSRTNGSYDRSRPPSASHLGLAEYASSHLDSDEVPPSPFIGSPSAFKSEPPPPLTVPSTLNNSRETTISTASGGALPTPKSATFNPSVYTRSASTAGSPVASTSRTNLPTRKGLIGKPLSKPMSPIVERKMSGGLSGGGIYPGGPRRPGMDGVRGHGRTQSLASSSPDLLESSPPMASTTPKTHGRSRLGGSMAVENFGSPDDRRLRNGHASGRLPPSIAEEPGSPDPNSSFTSTTSPPPSGHTTPSTSTPSLATPPVGGVLASQSNYPYSQDYQRGQSNALSSTFSLEDSSDYDPTDSTSALPGHGFYGVGQNETMESVIREGLEDWTRRATAEGPSSLGGSMSAGPTMMSFPDGSAGNNGALGARNGLLHPPNTIAVLWSFAHLEGTFEVEESLVKPGEFVEVKRQLLGGAGTGMGMGGGTLEGAQGVSGWKSWLFGNDPNPRGVGATLEERKNYSMKEKTIPTFSTPPSILGIDLVLEPGQSKSYNFSIRVPADLPPSFRGKSIKFSYHLVVGTNRTTIGPAAANLPSRSRVMRVPIRMYNHVGVSGARPFYDLTNPIVYNRDEATTTGVDDPKVEKRRRRPSSGRAEFESYAATLLDSVIGSLSPDLRSRDAALSLSPTILQTRSPSSILSPTMESVPAMRPEMRPQINLSAVLAGDDEEGEGCKSAVEIVSRNSQKVSYDINKDGYMVASLTLVKSAYRLGETVNGSVVINSGEGRVLRVSARLETHELIETTISTKPAPQIRQLTRRLHSEHHEMTLDSARVGFALAIPSGATPDFLTSGVKLQWSVRMSFLVIPPSPDVPLGKEGQRPRSGRSGAPPSHAPSASTSSATRHGRSKSFAYGFEPAVPLTLPAAPLIQPTGAAHLMPVTGPLDTSSAHTSYRAVPDLGYVPVLFSSSAPEPPPAPGPLQRTASGATGHRPTASMSGGVTKPPNTAPQTNAVLVPAKVETVECSIPIKVYPGNTPFRPTISLFDDTR
ncbi:Rgp1-domain-containing protein [Meredithblackwellia eburnea MCA 4105]